MYEQIIELLDQHRLKEALIQLQAFITNTKSWEMQADLENISMTYNYMLEYASQGMDDPTRESLYQSIRRKTYEIADTVNYIGNCQKKTGYLAGKYNRLTQNPPHRFQEIKITLETLSEDMALAQLPMGDETQPDTRKELYRRHEQAVDDLFDKAWASPRWTEEDFRQAGEFLTSLLIPASDIAVMLSAVTLSLLQVFDQHKFRFLLNAYQPDADPLVTQRALTGIALVVYYQGERLRLYPDLLAALSLLNETGNAAKDLLHIQTLLLLSRETEKIGKRMREEIIPQMIRKSGMLNQDMKIIDLEDLEDKNPEWTKDLKQIENSIRELGELQMEGADTYMSTFAQLKNYPFFRQAAHWFYPFDKQAPEIAELFQNEKNGNVSMAGLIMDSPIFCNSDKYSFCLTLFNLPPNQRDYLVASINAASENQSKEMQAITEAAKETPTSKTISRQYIHDLYRFCKLWPYKNEMTDIFKNKLDLWNCLPLKPLFDNPETLKRIADQLFAKDYMEEAAALYQRLNQEEKPTAEVMQKLGFCFQKMKNYEEAIKAYNQADLIKPDHIWTLKHLAQCYKRTRQYQQALECYDKVKEMQPDDLNLLLQMGQCLATMRQYDKALAYFFKVEYLDKTPLNAQRAIGWCYFMTGKYGDALRFYKMVTHADDAGTSGIPMADWLNMGHICLAMKNIPEALVYYRNAAALCKTHEEFIKALTSDKEALLEQGVSKLFIHLIPDML